MAEEGKVQGDRNQVWQRPAPSTRRALFESALGSGLAMALVVIGLSSALASPAPVTMNGVPEQVIPQVGEVGLGDFTMPTGRTSIGSDVVPGSGSGTGSGGGPGSGATTISLSGSSYDMMMSRSWGAAAASNSEAMGVDPVALASTCVVESGCRDVAGSGNITGAFQMLNATYSAAMAEAIAAHPELASSLTSGLAGQRDPATQAIAAAQYLRDAAQNLSSNGVANPTVLDARGFYNFGPKYGSSISQADGSLLMSTVLAGTSDRTLRNNGITATTTVQQWRDSVTSKIGASSASQPILLGA